jgi:hypothetical protein
VTQKKEEKDRETDKGQKRDQKRAFLLRDQSSSNKKVMRWLALQLELERNERAGEGKRRRRRRITKGRA